MFNFWQKNRQKRRGATLIEILAAIAIISLITAIALAAFGEYRMRQSKTAAAEGVLALMAQARLDTISSKHDATYGVLLRSDEIIYFKGSTYPGDGDASNISFPMPKEIEIANVVLGTSGGNEIPYNRLTGSTPMHGTFEVRVISRPELRTVITVHPTGASSLFTPATVVVPPPEPPPEPPPMTM